MMNLIKGILQVAALMAFSMVMNQLASWIHLPVPGSILGILVIFILLETHMIRIEWIDIGAKWLLAELLLFFVPAAVGIMNYLPMLQSDGLRIAIVVLISTFIVMACTGLMSTRISKEKENRAA